MVVLVVVGLEEVVEVVVVEVLVVEVVSVSAACLLPPASCLLPPAASELPGDHFLTAQRSTLAAEKEQMQLNGVPCQDQQSRGGQTDTPFIPPVGGPLESPPAKFVPPRPVICQWHTSAAA
ncbi:unnamed protein product [Gadus morhua 'NCC']